VLLPIELQPPGGWQLSAAKERLDALTGLRFLAAAGIVVIHWRGQGLPKEILSGWPLDNGVSFFFVLSGFILTFAYPALPDAKSIWKFLVARFARLWPLHVVTFVMVVAALHGDLTLRGPDQASPLVVLTNMTLTQAWVPVSNLYWGLNVPSWSISTEFFFYLIFPWLLRDFASTWWWKLLATFSIAIVLIVVATVAVPPPPKGLPVLNWWVSTTGLVYINPLARLPEFVTGMCLAIAFDRCRSRLTLGIVSGTALELAALATFVVVAGQLAQYTNFVHNTFGFPAAQWAAHGPILLPATALLIFAMALGRGAISRIIGSKVGIFLGDISFAVYLLHYAMAITYAYNRSFFKMWTGPELLAFAIVVLFIGSWLLFRFVELPMRRLIVNKFAQAMGGMSIPIRSATAESAVASLASSVAPASMRRSAASPPTILNQLRASNRVIISSLNHKHWMDHSFRRRCLESRTRLHRPCRCKRPSSYRSACRTLRTHQD
jgi:peptidoglycan/LPS O-acetylase OafA/YrhL